METRVDVFAELLTLHRFKVAALLPDVLLSTT